MAQPRGQTFKTLIASRTATARAPVTLTLRRDEITALLDLVDMRLAGLVVLDREDLVNHARLVNVRRKIIEAGA